MAIYATGRTEPLTADEIESMVRALDADPCPYTEGEANLIRAFVATLAAAIIDVERLYRAMVSLDSDDPGTFNIVAISEPDTRPVARALAAEYGRLGMSA